MSLAATHAKGLEPKGKEAASCLCNASCGAPISGRQALLVDPQSCSQCASMPEKILERRLRVPVANNQDPCLSGATLKATTSTHQPRATASWADMIDTESADMPPLFEELL